MDEHERRFYEYQTIARGRLTPDALRREFEPAARWYARRLGRLLPDDRDAPILDCPCGYGNILWFLRDAGYRRVHGIDLDPRQVALARSLDLPAAEADALAYLAAPPEPFATIFSVDFLEHLDRDAALRFLDLARAALRPGGRLIARTPCADGPFGAAHRYNDITHRWAMTAVTAGDVLRMCGFADVTILDERPQRVDGSLRTLRRVAAGAAARAVARPFFRALTGTAPKVWTRSMWIVGTA